MGDDQRRTAEDCAWAAHTTNSWTSTSALSRKELIVAPLASVIIGLQQARQGVVVGGEGFSAESASGVRAIGGGAGGRRRPLRCCAASRRDAQYELVDDIGVGGVGERKTIDLIQIPALVAATTTAAATVPRPWYATTTTMASDAVATAAAAAAAEVDWDVDHRSCNRISKGEIETDHRRLFYLQTTTNNAGMEEEEDDEAVQQQQRNNRTRITANTPTTMVAAASATREVTAAATPPINRINNQLDSELAPSWSKIRIKLDPVLPGITGHDQHLKEVEVDEEELVSNNVIKNGNHKYCYGTRNSATTRQIGSTTSGGGGLLTAALLLLLANVNTVSVWADTSIG